MVWTIVKAKIITIRPITEKTMVLLARSTFPLSPAEVIHKTPPYKAKITAKTTPVTKKISIKVLIIFDGASGPPGMLGGGVIPSYPGVFKDSSFIII